MQLEENSVDITPGALLEALGQGLFNWRDNGQVLALLEIDALKAFQTACQLARKRPAQGANMLHSLCEISAAELARELYSVFQRDNKISIEQLNKHLVRRKCRVKNGSKQDVKSLLDLIEPIENPHHDIQLENFVSALKESVHDYREVKVGKNLMQAYMLVNLKDRRRIMDMLTSDELHDLSAYLDNPKSYEQFLLEIPEDKLAGVAHEMNSTEREKLLRLILVRKDVDSRHLYKALSGLYHISDSGNNPKSLSDRGLLLSRLYKSDWPLDKISSGKLAIVLHVLMSDEAYATVEQIFKQQALSEKQIMMIDRHFKQDSSQKDGMGLKALIEDIHDHEGVLSLSTTTSRAYPVLLELQRLELTHLVDICKDAK